MVIGILACAWTLPAQAQRPLGVDVSHYEGTITQASWNSAFAAGRTFAFTKATEGLGSSLNDPTLSTNMTRARAAGIYIGAYHFGRPEANAAVAEADHFYAVASAYITPGYMRPVLDLESDGSTANISYLSQWVNDFCNEVKLKSGVEPIVYCNTNYAMSFFNSSVASHTLWVANYNNQSAQTGDPGTGVWAEWDFWQYTDVEANSGLGQSVDGDAFHNLANRPPLRAHVIPSIIRSPSTLSQTAIAGVSPASQSFTVRNGITGISVPLDYTITSDSTWLIPSPASGSSTGETDTITVNYSTTALAPGTHTGTLTITNGTTWYTPATVVVTLTVKPLPGDMNGDGKVNDTDLALFLPCMTGSDLGPPPAGCSAADIDGDNDVDSSDFGRMQRCMNGTLAPNSSCAN